MSALSVYNQGDGQIYFVIIIISSVFFKYFAELVAILIGSGNKDESAVALSQRILASVDHMIIHRLWVLPHLERNDIVPFRNLAHGLFGNSNELEQNDRMVSHG